MKKSSSYIFSADVIRVLAIAGVVLIHTANAVYARLDFFGGISWWIGIVLDSISRISIPLFIMLSGYLLLQKNESFTTSAQRAWRRVGIPLLFWVIVYAWWNGGHPSLANINTSYFLLLFTGKAFHLYFLFIVIGLYIASSFLRFLFTGTHALSQKYIVGFFLLAGVSEIVGEYAFHMCGSENAFNMWVPYTGLFVAGYFLGTSTTFTKKVSLLVLLYIGGLITTIAMNYLYFSLLLRGNNVLAPSGCLSQYSDYYLSINVVVMALAAFTLLLNFSYRWLLKNSIVSGLIHSIARASFTIYLIHILVVEFADSMLHLFDRIAPAWLYIFVKFGVVFFVCYVLALLLMRLPILKRLVGENK